MNEILRNWINEEPKRVNIDFPAWMVQSLDKEAKHVGVSRQAVIKMWLAENPFMKLFIQAKKISILVDLIKAAIICLKKILKNIGEPT